MEQRLMGPVTEISLTEVRDIPNTEPAKTCYN